MGIEVYLQCFGESESIGISRAAVRSLFPIIEDESKPDHWRVRYDDVNFCRISVYGVASDKEMLISLCVERPCKDLRLWDGLLSVLRMGSVVIFWPGGPPVVAEGVDATNLPEGMTDALGRAKSARSVDELLKALSGS